MTTSTAAAPRKARKPAVSCTAKTRDAARRREIVRVVRPIVRRLVAEAMEDHLDILASRAARAEPGESIPWEEVKRRLGL